MTNKLPSQPTILVVDDEHAIVALLEEILGDAGYRVLIARNGREALQCLEQQPADLVLSDVMMPVMDGLALYQAIKHSPALQRIPVILMSAVATINAQLRQQSAQMLPKPFDLDQLLSTIDQHLAA